MAKIAASIAEFGWTVPCLVGEEGEMIVGHGRVLAATQLGLRAHRRGRDTPAKWTGAPRGLQGQINP